jgi:phosphate-selective porin OprO/OprP
MNRVDICLSVIVVAGCWLLSTVAQAQEPTVAQQLAEFRARIESLERENAELRVTRTVPERVASPVQSLNTADGMIFAPPADVPVEQLPPSEPWPSPSAATGEACEPEGHVIGSDLNMSAYWKDGLEVATKQKDFRVHVGGRAQVDAGWFDAEPNVQEFINQPYENGADFRRARLRVDGTMYGFIEFATEYDFVNGFEAEGVDRSMTGLADCWVIFNDMPIGNVRVGQQKPAIGFEHLVSSRFLPFMERSYNQDSFYGGLYNGFLPGVSVFDAYGVDQEGGTWNVGLFKPTDNVFAASAHDGDYMTVGRVTKLMWYVNEGESLLHIGGSVAQQTTIGGRTIYRTRDAIRTGLAPSWPVPASTGFIGGDDIQWLNGEIAAVNGPWTFQAEYLTSYMTDAAPIVNNVVQTPQGDVFYQGGYAQLLYFLTGEHDNYDKLLGVFTRVRPHENFFAATDECGRRGGGGCGAWQLGFRYDYLDLNDDGFNGGILHNGTAGVNWFLNPNMKIQFNYMLTHRDAARPDGEGDGWINGFGSRFAMDF